MTNHEPIEFTREHELITRLVLQLVRNTSSKYFPRQPAHHQLDLTNMLLHVIIGHIERKPVTVSTLARTFGTSRATTLRWLSELIEGGYVGREDKVYWVMKNETNNPTVRNAVANNASLIIATAEELKKVAKMNA